MRIHRSLLLVTILLMGATTLPAQHHRGGGGRGGLGGFGGFGAGASCGFGGSGGFGGFGLGGYGYGGYGYYPSHYPPYPYPALMPQQPQYTVAVLEATHDWRNWDPTTKLIVGPVVAGTDARVIGMGVPQWVANSSEPLGDVARRYRELAAKAPRPAGLYASNQ